MHSYVARHSWSAVAHSNVEHGPLLHVGLNISPHVGLSRLASEVAL